MFTSLSLLNLCISFLRTSFQNYVIITSQQLTKFMIMQLETQADLIAFYLESINLPDRIKSNLEVLNYGKKLVKIWKINPSILLKSSFKKTYWENTNHTVSYWLSIVCTVSVRIWTCESFATNNIVCTIRCTSWFYYVFVWYCIVHINKELFD